MDPDAPNGLMGVPFPLIRPASHGFLVFPFVEALLAVRLPANDAGAPPRPPEGWSSRPA
jgi:hypothetical protein